MRKRAIGLAGVFAVFLVVVFGGVPTVYAETSVRYGTDYENAVPTTTQTENIYYAQKADSYQRIFQRWYRGIETEPVCRSYARFFRELLRSAISTNTMRT